MDILNIGPRTEGKKSYLFRSCLIKKQMAFFGSFCTIDKTWVYHFNSEKKF